MQESKSWRRKSFRGEWEQIVRIFACKIFSNFTNLFRRVSQEIPVYLINIINAWVYSTSRWVICYSNVQLKDSSLPHAVARVWRFQRHVSHGEFRPWRHWSFRDYLIGRWGDARLNLRRSGNLLFESSKRDPSTRASMKLYLGCRLWRTNNFLW